MRLFLRTKPAKVESTLNCNSLNCFEKNKKMIDKITCILLNGSSCGVELFKYEIFQCRSLLSSVQWHYKMVTNNYEKKTTYGQSDKTVLSVYPLLINIPILHICPCAKLKLINLLNYLGEQGWCGHGH